MREVAGDIDASFVLSLKVVRQRGVSAKLVAAHGALVRTQGGVRRGCVLLELVPAGEFLVTLAAVESPPLVRNVLVCRCKLQRLERLSADLTTVTHSFVVLFAMAPEIILVQESLSALFALIAAFRHQVAVYQLLMLRQTHSILELLLTYFTSVRQALVNFNDVVIELLLAGVHPCTLKTPETYVFVYNTVVLLQIARVRKNLITVRASYRLT